MQWPGPFETRGHTKVARPAVSCCGKRPPGLVAGAGPAVHLRAAAAQGLAWAVPRGLSGLQTRVCWVVISRPELLPARWCEGDAAPGGQLLPGCLWGLPSVPGHMVRPLALRWASQGAGEGDWKPPPSLTAVGGASPSLCPPAVTRGGIRAGVKPAGLTRTLLPGSREESLVLAPQPQRPEGPLPPGRTGHSPAGRSLSTYYAPGRRPVAQGGTACRSG